MSPDSPASFDQDLLAWLDEHAFGDARAEALAGDVSARRYLRLRRPDSQSAILAVYPEAIREVCSRFARTTALFESVEVPVPAVLAADCSRGWMLIEDLGERTLYDLGSQPWSTLEGLYAQAIEWISRIERLPKGIVAELNPPLDGVLLRRELERTIEMFLTPRGFLRDPAVANQVATGFDALCARLGETEPVVCHRDFMARNLVPRADAPSASSKARLWVLDHQDLRLGPPGYDLASLLNDSLFPPSDVEARLLALAPQLDPSAQHRVAAQRSLKAVGTYATFAARGNPRHIPLIGPTFARALHHLDRAPEGRAIAALLRRGSPNPIC